MKEQLRNVKSKIKHADSGKTLVLLDKNRVIVRTNMGREEEAELHDFSTSEIIVAKARESDMSLDTVKRVIETITRQLQVTTSQLHESRAEVDRLKSNMLAIQEENLNLKSNSVDLRLQHFKSADNYSILMATHEKVSTELADAQAANSTLVKTNGSLLQQIGELRKQVSAFTTPVEQPLLDIWFMVERAAKAASSSEKIKYLDRALTMIEAYKANHLAPGPTITLTTTRPLTLATTPTPTGLGLTTPWIDKDTGTPFSVGSSEIGAASWSVGQVGSTYQTALRLAQPGQ